MLVQISPSSYHRGPGGGGGCDSINTWLKNPHDLCWQLSEPPHLPPSPLVTCAETVDGQKEKRQMSHRAVRCPSTCFWWCCLEVRGFSVDSAFWTGGRLRCSPVNNQYQKMPAVIQLTPEASTSLCVSVCARLPFQDKWIGWMAHGFCASAALAGRQIMRQQLHCWHQVTLLNKRYRQSADPTSSSLHPQQHWFNIHLLYLYRQEGLSESCTS